MPLYTQSSHSHRRRHRSHSLRARVSRIENKIPQPEHKWYDVNPDGVITYDNNGVIIPLDQISQGTGQSNRIGDSVKASASIVRYTLQRQSVDAFVRVIHFIWKSNDIPSVTNILQEANYIAPLNRDFGMNIRVIRDRTYTIALGETQLQVEKWSKKMWYTNKYDADNVTTTSMNGYYVLFISDQGTASNSPLINYYHRLSYTDS